MYLGVLEINGINLWSKQMQFIQGVARVKCMARRTCEHVCARRPESRVHTCSSIFKREGMTLESNTREVFLSRYCGRQCSAREISFFLRFILYRLLFNIVNYLQHVEDIYVCLVFTLLIYNSSYMYSTKSFKYFADSLGMTLSF